MMPQPTPQSLVDAGSAPEGAPVVERSKQNAAVAAFGLALLTVACLLPFLGKAAHIDDPLFLWCAQHIWSHPFDPYGFSVIWGLTSQPMWAVTKNPPLLCYPLALAETLGNWSGPFLHACFMASAVAAIVGTYFLARRLCREPVLAACATLLNPVFLVCATGMTCDVPMVALWVWSVVFWLDGMDAGCYGKLIFAAFLMGAAALTKYFGAALIPMLFLTALVQPRKPRYWPIVLAIPVVMLAAYLLAMQHLYGQNMLQMASVFASGARNTLDPIPLWERTERGLAFAGGCLPMALAFLGREGVRPGRWPRFALWLAPLPPSYLAMKAFMPHASVLLLPVLVAECTAFTLAAFLLARLTWLDVRQHRDSASILLASWLAGTWFFATFLNWTINGRSVLPAAPAAAILLARALGGAGHERGASIALAARQPNLRLLAPLASIGLLAMLVAAGDCSLANCGRTAARDLTARYLAPGHRLWFAGHWGFQYYAQRLGATPLDYHHFDLRSGDRVVLPANNYYAYLPPLDHPQVLATYGFDQPWPCNSTSMVLGAGFYSSFFGPLPFVVGPAPPEGYEVLEVTHPLFSGAPIK